MTVGRHLPPDRLSVGLSVGPASSSGCGNSHGTSATGLGTSCVPSKYRLVTVFATGRLTPRSGELSRGAQTHRDLDPVRGGRRTGRGRAGVGPQEEEHAGSGLGEFTKTRASHVRVAQPSKRNAEPGAYVHFSGERVRNSCHQALTGVVWLPVGTEPLPRARLKALRACPAPRYCLKPQPRPRRRVLTSALSCTLPSVSCSGTPSFANSRPLEVSPLSWLPEALVCMQLGHSR